MGDGIVPGSGGARLGRFEADNVVFRLGFAAHGRQEEGVELRGTRATGRNRGGLAVHSFSPMQNIMKNRPGHQERLAQKVLEAMPMVEFSPKLAEL